MIKLKSRVTKSWRDKLEKKMEPVIKPAPETWASRYGGYKMLIPTPMLVDRVLRMVPEGKLITIGIIRSYLADKYEADFTCPLTTGIFLRISAEAAEEDKQRGLKDITPYWRALKDDGTLNPKFPGGVELQAEKLREEGFVIVPKGKKNLMVKDFKDYYVVF
jgi:hypothetical protein